MELAEKISLLIQDALSPTIGLERRSAAHHELDNIIQNLDPVQNAEVSLYLCGTSPKIEVVISSLQFLYVVIKFKWHFLPEPSRAAVKESLTKLMELGFQHLPPNSQRIVHEPMAKVIVEICKREWPQLWPDLLPRLFQISHMSLLPLLVIRRLAEDVIMNGGINSDLREERKDRLKELNLTLTAVAPDIFRFLFGILVTDLDVIRGTTTLSCLQAFFEPSHLGLLEDEDRIFTLLALFYHPELKCEAAETIIVLLEKIRSCKKATQIPNLFLSTRNQHVLHGAVIQCTKIPSDQLDSGDGLFLQRIGEILNLLIGTSTLTNQFIGKILYQLENLMARGDLAVLPGVLIALNALVNMAEKMKDAQWLHETLIAFIFKELNRMIQGMVCASNSKERKLVSQMKTDLSTLIKYVGKRRFAGMYDVVHCWIASFVSTLTPTRMSPQWNEVNQKWEILAIPLDAISTIIPESDRTVGNIGLGDFALLLRRFDDEGDLEIKSKILSCISPLFPFVYYRPVDVKYFCRSILACYIIPTQPEGTPEATSLRSLRRHVGALLIKLSTRNSKLMLSLYDEIKDFAWTHNGTLGLNELHAFIETLLILSDKMNNAERQRKFLVEIILPKEWESISNITTSTERLLSHFENENDLSRLRRLIILNLLIFRSTLKRISPRGIGVNRIHPAHDLLLPNIPVVLQLVKVIHGILNSPAHVSLFELTPAERANLLGVAHSSYPDQPALPVPKTFYEKAQTFMSTLTELVYSILGESCVVLSPGIYAVPHLGNAYFQYVGSDMHLLSDYKVRTILRNIFRPLTLNCPVNKVDSVTRSFLQAFCPFIRDRLSRKWDLSDSRIEGGNEECEILANATLRMLSKEVFDWLCRLLEMKSVGGDEGRMDLDDKESHRATELGYIGNLIMKDEVSFNAITILAGTAIKWNDMSTNLRASRVLYYFLPRITECGEIYYDVLAQVLKTIGNWVKADSNFDMLFRIFDGIFIKFHDVDPRFTDCMSDFGMKKDEIGRLKALSSDPKGVKKRKDIIRRLVISKESSGQLRSCWLRGLPALAHMIQKEKKGSNEEINLQECFTPIHSK